jgi:Ca-activated chloride channel homolog
MTGGPTATGEARLPLLTDDEVALAVPGGDETGVGTLATERGNLPLEAVDVAADVAGLLARVVVTQTFSNPHLEPLEATYIFPLPDRAAVTAFRMEVGGRVVEGVLEERAKARADYDRAVGEGRRASIAEEERPGVFTMRVGNLMPGERASVRLALAGPLPYADGEATFRFPLVVAPRYVPGVPLPGEPAGDGTALDTDAVPDASRITPPVLLPGFPNPIRLSITARVDPAGLPLTGLRSSLHALVEEEQDGIRVVRTRPGERANRDFVLRLAIGAGAVATSLATVADDQGDQGTFALTLVPPATAAVDRPRDAVFVLDRSGSMAGWKMVAARRALARMVDTLAEGDRFAVLAFDDVVDTSAGPGLRPASDRNRFQAVEYLARVDARGGTEMAEPLRQALDLLTGDGAPEEATTDREARGVRGGAFGPPEQTSSTRERVLVLVTDGQVANSQQLLRLVAERVQGVRVFTVGVDTAVNAAFLRQLAGLGGGACELVESEDRLDVVMDRIHRRIATPVLTDLRVEAGDLAIYADSVAPGRLPDLFAGAPLVIGGRWRGRPGGSVTVRGREPSGRPWEARVPATAGANPVLTAVWARARLRDLEDAWAVGRGTDPELEQRIVRTSLEYGVLCRFTAFVAVDAAVVNQGGRVRRLVQPVDAPDGWDMFAGQAAGPMAAPAATMARFATPGIGGLAATAGGPAGGRGRSRWQASGSPAGLRTAVVDPELDEAVGRAYRRRAGELHALFAAGRPAAAAPVAVWAGRLAELRARLEALLADLESVGATADPGALRSVRQLLADLEGPLASPAPGADQLRHLWDRALAVLAALAALAGPPAGPGPAPGPPPDPARPGDFWRQRPV